MNCDYENCKNQAIYEHDYIVYNHHKGYYCEEHYIDCDKCIKIGENK